MARPLAAVRAAAEGGDLAAMDVLAECFYRGVKGATEDKALAVVWRRRAAAANVARAQCSLGFMHARGEGGLLEGGGAPGQGVERVGWAPDRRGRRRR